MLPFIIVLPAGRRYQWRTIIVDARMGRGNSSTLVKFDHKAVWTTRWCLGPLAFTYSRQPRDSGR